MASVLEPAFSLSTKLLSEMNATIKEKGHLYHTDGRWDHELAEWLMAVSDVWGSAYCWQVFDERQLGDVLRDCNITTVGEFLHGLHVGSGDYDLDGFVPLVVMLHTRGELKLMKWKASSLPYDKAMEYLLEAIQEEVRPLVHAYSTRILKAYCEAKP